MKPLKHLFLIVLLISLSCKKENNSTDELTNIYTTLKTTYAPDKRVELFDINFEQVDNQLILEGETTSKEAFSILLDSLKNRNVKFTNNVRILPDDVVGLQQYAVARNSVINIRSNPKHSAELGTQGLLGMSVKVLDKKGDFYRIQTPDKYISWVDRGGIQLMNKSEFDAWNNAKKVIFTETYGYTYVDKSENSKIVSDITLGALLQYVSEDNDFYEVKYPDNRIAFLKKNEAVMYNSWLESVVATKENVETAAKTMTGFPYLWGGTSSKGIDCSGFTKMVYLMNGFIIPRDASQQINAGKTVDKDLKFEGLEKGDLMFFGKKATADAKQRVTHVGIWLGNDKMEFIHSAGNVHLSSMNADEANYDEFNKNRYLGSQRYLGVEDKMIVDLKEKIKL
ncbi:MULTISPECIES: C40 family peptidase [Polaribacter]|uniref:C40 family peptidase n=1 Tax=Polaribacter sejongensis TaxID=985043 RepID=A0AAJ1QX84_9FLAO|nr:MULTISPECIES: C40 family peptidase [Polaribacter]MDN3619261.1 C40 family peptidase [Polaribacter undariae]UWD33538.1 C40 family peptidase [Polaribacter undariae]